MRGVENFKVRNLENEKMLKAPLLFLGNNIFIYTFKYWLVTFGSIN
jgi:hypothetical protein